jgi:glycosyltransferase involved in cell wall biosynthesis
MLDGRGGLTYGTEQELVGAMDTLLRDPTRREALGRQARETFLAEWTAARHFERYFSLIADLRQGAVACA